MTSCADRIPGTAVSRTAANLVDPCTSATVRARRRRLRCPAAQANALGQPPSDHNGPLSKRWQNVAECRILRSVPASPPSRGRIARCVHRAEPPGARTEYLSGWARVHRRELGVHDLSRHAATRADVARHPRNLSMPGPSAHPEHAGTQVRARTAPQAAAKRAALPGSAPAVTRREGGHALPDLTGRGGSQACSTEADGRADRPSRRKPCLHDIVCLPPRRNCAPWPPPWWCPPAHVGKHRSTARRPRPHVPAELAARRDIRPAARRCQASVLTNRATPEDVARRRAQRAPWRSLRGWPARR